MTSYRYLGTGTTNANGVATYNYPSKGAGDVNIVASLDNPIESDSIISDPFIVHDYYLYDSGVSDGQKNKNVIKGTNVTEQVTSNGTVLTCTNGTSLATAQYTYTKVIGGDFEAYVTLTTPSSILMGFYGGSDSTRISISNVENRTYKFKRTGSNWIVQYYNGSEWVDLSFHNNTLGNKDCRFYLYLYSDNETDTVTFKDVKVSVESVLNIGGDSIVQTGDTINITGKFYDMGVPVKNIDLDIYKNGVKVDTVNTGSTGVASYSYEGSGVGEVNFQYKYGSFVSVPYNVFDSILAFDGTSVTSNFRTVTDITLSVDDGFVKMAQSSTNKWQTFTVNGQNTGWIDPSNNYRVEFDYIAPTTDYSVFSLCGSAIRLNNGSANEEHHIKIEQVNGVINAYLDNNPTPYVTVNVGASTDASFGLFSIEYLKIKNFVIYPI